jgi:predicted aminopeptidase
VVNGLGIWWRKLGLDGTNVNELTSQRLTDLGRAPVFYDCLVEVERADEAGDSARAVWCVAWRVGCLAAPATGIGPGYYWQSVTGHLTADARGAAGAGLAGRPRHAAGAAAEAAADAAHPHALPSPSWACPTTPATGATPTCGAGGGLQRGGRARAVAALQQWCFPVAGCVGYRGYFDEAEARAFAASLDQDLDVAVYPVPAYSTWAG